MIPILPPAWQPNTPYAYPQWVCPATKSSSALSQAIFQCLTAGTSGATEPAWDLALETHTSDGPVVWVSNPALRLIGTVTAPVSASQFVVQPLIFPAGQTGTVGNITVQNNVSAGSALEISDGIKVAAVYFEYDTAGGSVLSLITGALATAGLLITGVHTETLSLELTNNSGKQGSITKSGDVALPPALVIADFAPGYMDGGTLSWITGQNAGVSMEIKLYDINTTSVILWQRMHFPITAGDTFFYFPGCDKRRETCWGKFNNIVNFRGEPDIPGLDRMLAYPDSS